MKTFILSFFLFSSLLVASRAALVADKAYDNLLSRFAFGSCNKHDKEQPIWSSIIDYKPELFIWLGDIVYADHAILPTYGTPSPLPVMQKRFNAQKGKEGYQKLMNTCPITGAWDDHDYGLNNGGSEYTDKKESQKILLNFLDEPSESPRWKREGVYASYIFGPPGKKVQIIILDARYFRDRIGNYSGDTLGSSQWEWLEQQMKIQDIQLRIITSGVQILPLDKPIQEKWAQFPLSRAKLMEMIGKYQIPTFLLSGDVHYSEIHRSNCTGIGYPLYELTSSGMTHCMGTQAKIPGLGKWILDHIFYSDYRVGPSYEMFNFGTVEILWDRNPVEVVLQSHAVTGEVVLEQRLSLDELKRESHLGDPRYICQEPEADELAIIPVEYLRDTFLLLVLLVVLIFVVVFCITRCCSSQKAQLKKKIN